MMEQEGSRWRTLLYLIRNVVYLPLSKYKLALACYQLASVLTIRLSRSCTLAQQLTLRVPNVHRQAFFHSFEHCAYFYATVIND